MGHHVEYLVDLSTEHARSFFTPFGPTWSERDEVDAALSYCELEWEQQALHVELAHTACLISVPTIKYSWLINEHRPTTLWIERFERWLSETMPNVLTVRLDEITRLEWETQTGRDWYDWLSPVKAVADWLRSSAEDARHFRLLPDEHSHPRPRS